MKVVPVIKKLDLAGIASCTDLPVRTLRYVIDHDLVAGLRVQQDGRGSARQLSLFDATVLASAATLLTMGLNASCVRSMMAQYRGATRTDDTSFSFWQGYQTRRRDFTFDTKFGWIGLDWAQIHSSLKECSDD